MELSDFDMDLYNVLPEAQDMIAPVANVMLMTNGSLRDGKLSHPSVWNGDKTMLAFFDFAPEIVMPQHRIAPRPYSTSEPAIKCSFEETMRDCWIHDYAIYLQKGDRWGLIWDSFQLMRLFDTLMGHIRGYNKREPEVIEHAKEAVLESIRVAVARFSAAIEWQAMLTGKPANARVQRGRERQ